MDASLLDALECAICLNPLNSYNRVLPCQHTFCRQCLDEVAAARGPQLLCPECRAPVLVPLDSLPQNIVLIRLLESLGRAGAYCVSRERKEVEVVEASSPSSVRYNSGGEACEDYVLSSSVCDVPASVGQEPDPDASDSLTIDTRVSTKGTSLSPLLSTLEETLAEFDPFSSSTSLTRVSDEDSSIDASRCGSQTPVSRRPRLSLPTNSCVVESPPSSPNVDQPSSRNTTTPIPSASALYDHPGQQEGGLSFKKGDVILLRRRLDGDWFEGQLNGRVGSFPANRVQVLSPLPNQEPVVSVLTNHITPQCRALSSFSFPDQNGVTYLRFEKDDIVTMIRAAGHAWVEGRLGARQGVFPLSLVELNLPARQLLLNSSNSCSRTRPGELQSSSEGPAPCSRPPVPPPLPCRSPAGAVPLPCRRQSATSSPLRPHPVRRSVAAGHRLVSTCPTGTSDTASSTSTQNRRHTLPQLPQGILATEPPAITREERGKSSEIKRSCRNPLPLMIQRFRCTMEYPAGSDSELPLSVGDIVYVHRRRDDGWMKGTLERTGRTGLFPAMFVEPC